jgi:hypothetical protein
MSGSGTAPFAGIFLILFLRIFSPPSMLLVMTLPSPLPPKGVGTFSGDGVCSEWAAIYPASLVGTYLAISPFSCLFYL